MVSISFTHPHYLFFLLIIPIFIFIHLVTLKTNKAAALKFANFEAMAKIKGVEFFSKNIIVLLLSSLIILFMVLGLSGFTVHTVLEASEHSFVIGIDSSRSMEADDVKPTRMEAAKLAALDFVDELPRFSKVGIVSFAGSSFIEEDLSDSKLLTKSAIKEIQINNVAGTDLYDVVLTGSNMLKGEKSKVVIILSDGQINVGNLKEVISYANENDVIVYTIGFGTEEGGKTSFGFSKIDEDSLKAIAFNTEGDYFRAMDKDELNSALSSIIQKGERRVAINISQYSILLAIAIFVFIFYFINSKYRRW